MNAERGNRKRKILALALLGTAMVLIFTVAGFLGWIQLLNTEHQEELGRLKKAVDAEVAKREEREAQARQAVENALKQTATLLKEQRWREAETTLNQAANLLAGKEEDLRKRIEAAQKDTQLLKRLDAIRLNKSVLLDGKLNFGGAARDYEEALRAHGLDLPKNDEKMLVSKIKAAAIQEQLMAALEDWAATETNEEVCQRLLHIARQVMPDREKWLDALCDPQTRKDLKKLENLAAQADMQRVSPALQQLGVFLELTGGDGVRFLQKAQLLHPMDFWGNLTLANLLAQKGRLQWDEAIAYYRVALAIKPDCPVVHQNLGAAFLKQGRIQEARAATQKALNLLAKDDPMRPLALRQLEQCESLLKKS